MKLGGLLKEKKKCIFGYKDGRRYCIQNRTSRIREQELALGNVIYD